MSKQFDGAEDEKHFDYVRREDGFAEAGRLTSSEAVATTSNEHAATRLNALRDKLHRVTR